MGHTFEASFPTEVKNGTAFKDGFVSVYPLGTRTLNGVKPNPVIYFHFELISRAEREAIPARYCVQDICNVTSPIGTFYAAMTCEDVYQVAKVLPADETPPTYAQNYNLVNGHVGHYLIPTTKPSWTPDLNDGISPSELIYVTCFGHICGMFVKAEFDHLNATIKLSDTVCETIYTPQAFFKAGQYPTQVCYEYDEASDSYRVYLTKFAYFRASTGILDPFEKKQPRQPK